MLSMRNVSLGILVIQTSIHVLLVRYSRTVDVKGKIYLPSTVVVLAEFLKVFACVAVLFYRKGFHCHTLCNHLKTNIILKYPETLKLIVPSGLYVIQNNLLYISLTTLDAATYQITYQMKILTTAVFAVIVLGKKLSLMQWLSLLLLVIGVALIQFPNESFTEISDNSSITSDKLVSILCVIAACFSSGFAGIYFEKLLKGSVQSLWVRNIQLGSFGIIFGFLNVFVYDGHMVQQFGFFQGFSWITWLVIILQAFGGLVVSLVIKYADNILKSFAASISIIFSTLFSYYIFNDLILSSYFMLGAPVVICASIIYGFPVKSSTTKLASKLEI